MSNSATDAARIAIDARYLSHGLVGGVHTYTRNLIEALSAVGTERQWVWYADSKAPFDLPALPPHVTLRTLPWRNGVSSVVNDLRLGRLMRRDGATVAHTPANYGFTPAALPLVITLHDAINVQPIRETLRDDAKNPRHLLLMSYLHLMTRAATARQPFVITVSNYSRQEILRHTALAPDRVRVIYSAHERCFRPQEPRSLAPLRERLGLKPQVLLADAIKNPDCVLRAFRALSAEVRATTSLVFFARRPPSTAVEEAACAGECVLISRPPRELLISLYGLADLFLFPSWYEGFGLPALEALACGTPVIASSRGSLPEVVGTGGIIIDAEDHAAMAVAITRFLRAPAQLAGLRRAALAQAGRFSWEETARQTLAVYDEATARGHLRRPQAKTEGVGRAGGMGSW